MFKNLKTNYAKCLTKSKQALNWLLVCTSCLSLN